MVYDIIFYHSGRTAEAERVTERRLSPLSLQKGSVYAAVSPSELVKGLSASLGRADIVIITGGLDGGVQSTDNILSLVLSSRAASMKCEKLLDDDDNTGYLIKAGRQYILVLPDEPDSIAAMLDKRIIRELCAGYSLTPQQQDGISIDEVTGEIKKELSGMRLTRGSYGAEYAAKQQKQLRLMRVLSYSALGAGILLVILAVVFSFV